MPRDVSADSEGIEIKEDEMKEAMLRSGYLLEYRAEDFFRQRQMIVEANAAYLDPSTQKSRELDLVVRNAESISFNGKSIGQVAVRIIFECKNNPQPICFFLKGRSSFSFGDIIKSVTHPLCLYDKELYSPLISSLEPYQFHHYAVKQVATQYCTFQKKRDSRSNEKWQAKHTEAEFDSFEKLCDAVDYFMEYDRKYLASVPNKKIAIVLLTYPVMLLGGKLTESSPGKDGLNLKECDHIQFVRTRANPINGTQYNIDVISERYLPTLVGQINSELKEIASRLMKDDCSILRDSLVARPQVKVFRPGTKLNE